MKIYQYLCVIILAVLVTGCSILETEEAETTMVASYSIGDMGETEGKVEEGVWLRDNGILYRGYTEFKTFTNTLKKVSTDNTRVIWYTDQFEAVPHLSSDGSFIYYTTSNLPSNVPLEGFEQLEYSVGIKGITKNKNGEYRLTTKNNLQSTSTAYAQLNGYSEIRLYSINGIEFSDNLINKVGAISGLEYGKLYTIGFYIGSYYKEVDVLCDTQFFVSKSLYTLDTITLTKEGYAVIEMPQLLEPALYELDGKGAFWYDGVSVAEQDETHTLGSEIQTQQSFEGETLPTRSYDDITEATDSNESLVEESTEQETEN